VFGAGDVTLEGVPTGGLPYLVSQHGRGRPLVYITAETEDAWRAAADLEALGVPCTLFPAEAHVPFDPIAPDSDLMGEQLALRAEWPGGLVVTSAAALQQRWPSRGAFDQHCALWSASDTVPLDALRHTLVRCGYAQVNQVEDGGTFAVRGSIVDVFVPGHKWPVRIDLFGDEIAWIKSFEPATGRTLSELETLLVHPIREVVFCDETVARASDRLQELAESQAVPTRRMHELLADIAQRNYFFGVESLWPLFYRDSESVLATLLQGTPWLVLDNPDDILAKLRERWQSAHHARARATVRQDFVLPVESLLLAPEEVLGGLSRAVRSVPLADGPALRPCFRTWEALARETELRRKNPDLGDILEPLQRTVAALVAERYEVILCCSGRGNAERLRELLCQRGVDLPLFSSLPQDLGRARRTPRVGVAVAPYSGGFADDAARVALITDAEIFGVERRIRRKRPAQPTKEALSTLQDLRDGERVLHVDHGIGAFRGLKRLVLDGADGDFVLVEYQGGDKLYLPIYRIGQLRRHIGAPDAPLDKLGGQRWERAKQKVRDSVLVIAHKLLALQAQRQALPGTALPPPADEFHAFAAAFAFEETADQTKAIAAVLSDLAKARPMDRLVCGDVGFGKTEVAMRAAFLAIGSGKQVAVLVPTTVLAEQHGRTFGERMGPHGVNVEVLNRFRTPQETRDLLQRLKQGRVDVVIGTHRLLSSDVQFADLGLLVVDEEHRFGVRHKERMKEMKIHVHVLTLTATPIPRTMNMALLGLRDLSIIQTPPEERMAIRTEVARFDEALVQEVMRRELHRGGQVFVVHNRVQTIEDFAATLRQLVPEAKLRIAHGQMPGPKLEEAMVAFVRRQVDVLLCTAIIESGIDIPAANTLIVHRADTFGLAQLHQLRGRIGRGRERAYAYFLLPRTERIDPEAAERLAALKRHSELGAGFHIATHDMDIRGAGDLLGADQSGNILAVGFELYTELLGEAVERAKGERARGVVEPDIKIPIAAVLPDSYVQRPVDRLAYYQRMADASSDEAIFDLLGELEEYYGEAPMEARCLVEVMALRRLLQSFRVLGLSGAERDGEVRIGLSFLPDAPMGAVTLRRQAEPDRYRLLPSGRLMIRGAIHDDILPDALIRRMRHEVTALLSP
jgi:transcription-repair coupling factor (superfamily II helicase)